MKASPTPIRIVELHDVALVDMRLAIRGRKRKVHEGPVGIDHAADKTAIAVGADIERIVGTAPDDVKQGVLSPIGA